MEGTSVPIVLPGWMLAAVSLASLMTAIGVVVLAAILRVNDRPVPVWFVTIAAFAFGLAAGILLPSAGAVMSLADLVPLTAVYLPPTLIALAKRYDLAGWYLVGAGAPTLVTWGMYMAQGLEVDPGASSQSVVFWIAGTVGIVVAGVAGILAGDRTPDPAPRTPPTDPDPVRAVSIATAVERDLRFGPTDLPNLVSIVLGIIGGAVAAVVVRAAGADAILAAIASVTVTSLIATEIYYRVWPRRLNRAMAAHAFLGSWEMKRFVTTTGTKPPTSAAAAQAWLERNPETDDNRWVRPELLAWVGRIDEADAVLARLPRTTEQERFERRSMEAFVDIVAGRPADLAGLAEAAEQVGAPGSDERLRAVAAVGVNESRRRLAVGEGDWTEPLIRAQERIGPRSLGIQRADTWLARFRSLAIAFGAVLLLATLVGLLPT